jgi:hypothetical protein
MKDVSIFIQLGEKEVPCGQLCNGRYVYWSLTNTFMVKYRSPKGFHQALVGYLLEHNIKEVDLIMPSSAYRATVEDLCKAPLHTERGEAQRFLPSSQWIKIDKYDKPHYKTLPKIIIHLGDVKDAIKS